MGAINAVLLCVGILLSALWYYVLWRIRKRFHLSNVVYFTLYGVLQVLYIGTVAVIVWHSDIPYPSPSPPTVDRSQP